MQPKRFYLSHVVAHLLQVMVMNLNQLTVSDESEIFFISGLTLNLFTYFGFTLRCFTLFMAGAVWRLVCWRSLCVVVD